MSPVHVVKRLSLDQQCQGTDRSFQTRCPAVDGDGPGIYAKASALSSHGSIMGVRWRPPTRHR